MSISKKKIKIEKGVSESFSSFELRLLDYWDSIHETHKKESLRSECFKCLIVLDEDVRNHLKAIIESIKKEDCKKINLELINKVSFINSEAESNDLDFRIEHISIVKHEKKLSIDIEEDENLTFLKVMRVPSFQRSVRSFTMPTEKTLAKYLSQDRYYLKKTYSVLVIDLLEPPLTKDNLFEIYQENLKNTFNRWIQGTLSVGGDGNEDLIRLDKKIKLHNTLVGSESNIKKVNENIFDDICSTTFEKFSEDFKSLNTLKLKRDFVFKKSDLFVFILMKKGFSIKEIANLDSEERCYDDIGEPSTIYKRYRQLLTLR